MILWWCLDPEQQAALIQFQWDNYHEKLEIPPMTYKGVWLEVAIENPSEIGRLMRQPPSRSRGRDG